MRETINVPENDKFQVITEHPPGDLNIADNYLGNTYSKDIVIIQITMNAGRTVEMKKAFFKRIADDIHAQLKLRKDDVFINLVECVKENWSFGGGDRAIWRMAVLKIRRQDPARAAIELSSRDERQTRNRARVSIAARIEDNPCVFFRYRFWCLRVLRLRNPHLPSTATRSRIPLFLLSWLIIVRDGTRTVVQAYRDKSGDYVVWSRQTLPSTHPNPPVFVTKATYVDGGPPHRSAIG